MTRYYFHVRQHDVLEEDPEGAEFPSYEMAYEEAVRGAREIVADQVARGEIVDGQTFEITTESGEVIGTVPFSSVIKFK